jgi:Zn-dependent M28 family amino/carboxypeptidase
MTRHRPGDRRGNRRLATALVVALVAAAIPAAALAGGGGGHGGGHGHGERSHGCENRNLNSTRKFLACVSSSDVRWHMETLQDIADANDGTRASGTPGYDASADYVAWQLERAGFIVERQEFDFSVFSENSSSLTNGGVSVDTQAMTNSGSGTVTDGNVIAVDHDLGLGNSSTSGCEASDFDPLLFTGPADIAVIQRGACSFLDKALNAQDAGAEGVVIFNQGNSADRMNIIGGTLGDGAVGVITVPVLDTAYDDGVARLGSGPVSMSADTTIDTTTTENVIGDLPGVNPDNVVMAGAHLDSVDDGPGINDNGSGSATLLTVAVELGRNRMYVPQNTLRFAWWGAEESDMIGSDNYIFHPEFGLTDPEYFALALYLNFDMVGSPNYIFGVYDADQSTFPQPDGFIPPGSEALEDLFEAYYTIKGEPYEDSAFDGRSDHSGFISVGIPASGLFTGAEGIKTPEQAVIWGGVAGEQFDPCYHLACDTQDNRDRHALDVNVDAIAYAVYNLAASTEAVNGVVGVDVKGPTPDDVEFDGPQGTFLSGGGFTYDGLETS